MTTSALSSPIRGLGTLLSFSGSQIKSRLVAPDVPVRSEPLKAAHTLETHLRGFSLAVQKALMTHRRRSSSSNTS